MRSATQPYCNTIEYGCVSLRMRFFPQNFGTIKRILPGSSSPSHREGPGIEVACFRDIQGQRSIRMEFVIIMILFDVTDYRCYMVIVRYR